MGDRVKAARIGLHLSQEYVAKTAGMDITRLRAVESGESELTRSEAARLSAVYGIETDGLLYMPVMKESHRRILEGFAMELKGSDRMAVMGLLHMRDDMRKAG